MRNLVSSTLDQEFTAWNPESKTALNYHTWSETDDDFTFLPTFLYIKCDFLFILIRYFDTSMVSTMFSGSLGKLTWKSVLLGCVFKTWCKCGLLPTTILKLMQSSNFYVPTVTQVGNLGKILTRSW